MAACFLYNAWVIPFRYIFQEYQTDANYHIWFIIDYCVVDFLYLAGNALTLKSTGCPKTTHSRHLILVKPLICFLIFLVIVFGFLKRYFPTNVTLIQSKSHFGPHSMGIKYLHIFRWVFPKHLFTEKIKSNSNCHFVNRSLNV